MTRRLDAVLFGLALAGLYTSYALQIGAGRIAAGYAAVAGLALAGLSITSPSGGARLTTLALALVSLAFAWGLTIPFSPAPEAFLSEHLISLASLCVAFAAAWGVFNYARSLRRSAIATTFGVISIILVTLTILERYTAFVDISNAFRAIAYRDSFLYESDARDIEISGAIRPMLFTQEPSHLAKFMMVSIVIWSLSRTSRSLIAPLLGFCTAFYLTGSPTIVIGFAIYAIVLGNDYIDRLSVYSRSPAVKSVGRGVLFLVTLSMMYVYANFALIAAYLPFERAQLIADGRDASSIIRMAGAYTLAWKVTLAHPIAGAGIGGRELVQNILLEVYSSFGLKMERFYGSEGYTGWGNAFTEIFVYGGAVVGLIVYATQIIVTRLFIPRLTLLIPVFFLVFNMDAGFTSPRVWIYFALVSAALSVRYRTNAMPRALDPVSHGRPERRAADESDNVAHGIEN